MSRIMIRTAFVVCACVVLLQGCAIIKVDETQVGNVIDKKVGILGGCLPLYHSRRVVGASARVEPDRAATSHVAGVY